jgi:hypothetical protein
VTKATIALEGGGATWIGNYITEIITPEAGSSTFGDGDLTGERIEAEQPPPVLVGRGTTP